MEGNWQNFLQSLTQCLVAQILAGVAVTLERARELLQEKLSQTINAHTHAHNPPTPTVTHLTTHTPTTTHPTAHTHTFIQSTNHSLSNELLEMR